MKKYNVNFSFIKAPGYCQILLALICLALFFACDMGKNDLGLGKHEGLSAETERRIRQDYINSLPGGFGKVYIRDIWIEDFYGSYNGSYVVTFNGRNLGFLGGFNEIIINDILFRSGLHITVWKDRLFYTLNEAYELGFLTQENLRSIAYIRNGGEINP